MKEVLYIYTRASTKSQKDEGTSLDEQKRLGIAKAKELGMDYEVHEEGAKSGSGEDINDREVIANLLSLINQGHVNHVYVYHQDRLSGDTYVSARINYDLRKNNVVVHTSYGSYETSNPQDKLMMGSIGLIADCENTHEQQDLRLVDSLGQNRVIGYSEHSSLVIEWAKTRNLPLIRTSQFG